MANANNRSNRTLRRMYIPLNTLSTGSSNATTSSTTSSTPNTMTNTNSKRARQSSDTNGVSSSNAIFAGERDWTTPIPTPMVTLDDVGGVEHILQDIRELIERPMRMPQALETLGIIATKGVLLHGPPGVGKTLLAHAIVGELNRVDGIETKMIKVAATELVAAGSGESELRIREMFSAAQQQQPCVIFIDEIDAITLKRQGSQREMERRIVAQLIACMDSLKGSVVVLAATNQPDAMDSALRRVGRFDKELSIGMPDERARARILKAMCKNMRLRSDVDFAEIAKRTAGYVGADFLALTREAGMIALNRIFNSLVSPAILPLSVGDPNNSDTPMTSLELSNNNVDGMFDTAISQQVSGNTTNSFATDDDKVLDSGTTVTPVAINFISEEEAQQTAALERRIAIENKLRGVFDLTPSQLDQLYIETSDFFDASKRVQPSNKREGFATMPNVTWDDIGALEVLREELTLSILEPIRNPAQFAQLGFSVPAGVLLFGPPGCGKTLIAKAIAAESGASFMSVKGPELLNQFVGESEKGVRTVFARARSSAPCVLFFDELDALCPRRGTAGNGNQVSERVVNQLLTEMDGLDERKAVFVIAATNRPDMIDSAMLRPGRLDKLLYVRLPNAAEREAILRKHTRKTPITADVDLHMLAFNPKTDGYSGADCAALVREAALDALREAKRLFRAAHPNSGPHLPTLQVSVSGRHFESALNRIVPSVSEHSARRYDRMELQLRKARATIEPIVIDPMGVSDSGNV